MNNNQSELTILSVSYNSEQFLEKNYQLTKWLNVGQDTPNWEWIVIENSPNGSSGKINNNSNKFKVYEGEKPPDVPTKIQGSYHHGAALNKGLKYVNSRFLLILDPDFFIIKKNWISAVIDYMISHQVSIFGAPWHPRFYKKYRYFPCVHCLFIDIEKININKINFLPDLKNNPNSWRCAVWLAAQKDWDNRKKIQALRTLFIHPIRSLADDMINRFQIGSSRDTGYYFFKDFSNKRFHSQTIQPVFKRKQQNLMPEHVSSLQYSQFFQTLLPDRLCYIPKKKDYFSEKGFKDLSFFDIMQQGYDEFIWLNEPFGFHIRNFLIDNSLVESKNTIPFEEILDNIMNQFKN